MLRVDPYINPANFSDNSYSSASSDRSSVPPHTADSFHAASPPETTSIDSNSPPVITVRAKTAHTTIERRYRTNLKACIDRLSHSIPAVRVIDKDYKPPSGIPDVPDEKGLIDGVKAARKVSKAIIMSKAHEYIVYVCSHLPRHLMLIDSKASSSAAKSNDKKSSRA